MEGKNPFKSWTLWLKAAMAIVSIFFPDVIAQNPTESGLAAAGLGTLLRFKTKDKLRNILKR